MKNDGQQILTNVYHIHNIIGRRPCSSFRINVLMLRSRHNHHYPTITTTKIIGTGQNLQQLKLNMLLGHGDKDI